jgi:hypothetical protein
MQLDIESQIGFVWANKGIWIDAKIWGHLMKSYVIIIGKLN